MSNSSKLPFEVRRRTPVDEQLGDKAIVDGFIAVPVYTFIDTKVQYDSLDGGACHNVTFDLDRPEVLAKYADLIERNKIPIQKALNVSMDEMDGMKFHQMVQYCDAIFARNFEGILEYRPTESEW